MLICFSIFNVLVLSYRIHYSSGTVYLFLIWNLFLAWMPYWISLLMKRYGQEIKSYLGVSVLVIFWLVFFPNALYILTDLIHLRIRGVVPLWYDLILILSFSFNGVFLGYASLFNIQNFLEKKYKKTIGWLIAILALFLGSFGIYLGRFLRWNSWDLISNPGELFRDVWDRVANPLAHPTTYAVTILFSIFFILIYLILKVIGRKD